MSELVLSTDDLSFFRLTCDLFPSPESPLRYLEDEDRQPKDPHATCISLEHRGLLNPACSGAAPEVSERLLPVSECGGRVIVRAAEVDQRSFYMMGNFGVEYRLLGDGQHGFGSLRSEGAVAAELAQAFCALTEMNAAPLRMSAGDYLVFAVFARDVREGSAAATAPSSPAAAAGDEDTPMSLDEVLAFFDEPETNYVRTPSDDSWERSIATLVEQGVLRRIESASAGQEKGYALAEDLHPFARELTAESQQTITRFDYLDQQWLVREVHLYPTRDSVYRLGTAVDGSVVIQELTSAALANTVAGVVSKLPNILNPDVPALLLSGRAPQAFR